MRSQFDWMGTAVDPLGACGSRRLARAGAYPGQRGQFKSEQLRDETQLIRRLDRQYKGQANGLDGGTRFAIKRPS